MVLASGGLGGRCAGGGGPSNEGGLGRDHDTLPDTVRPPLRVLGSKGSQFLVKKLRRRNPKRTPAHRLPLSTTHQLFFFCRATCDCVFDRSFLQGSPGRRAQATFERDQVPSIQSFVNSSSRHGGRCQVEGTLSHPHPSGRCAPGVAVKTNKQTYSKLPGLVK